MNIAIVGAGVLGRLLALTLIEQKHQITVIDKQPLHDPSNAAYVSAGMLCPLGEIIHAPAAVVTMGLESLKVWPDILSQLQALDTDNESVFFAQQGSLALSFPADASSFAQLKQDLEHKMGEQRHQVETLNRQQLLDLEPALNKFSDAVLLGNEGQLCNRSFLRSSTRVIGKYAATELANIETTADWQSLCNRYDWVLDCRGSGAIANTTSPTDMTQLRGLRGEVIRVRCTEVQLSRPVRVVHPRASIYIVPKPNHEFVIGATEIESHSEHPITVRSTLELLSTLYAVNSGFAEAVVLETNVGIRAAFDDHQPRVERQGNLISANGLYRHGWLVGPALAQQVLNLMQEATHERDH